MSIPTLVLIIDLNSTFSVGYQQQVVSFRKNLMYFGLLLGVFAGHMVM